jgi:acyl-[acyl-carrier-protein]-phospholipid O-acyltransferase/long-chain-fatty-acid--[acyl-carrier-protein] ligase
LLLMLPLGVASGLLAVPLNVLAQWRAPSQRRGAVIALSNTFVFAGVIGGSLGAGALARLGLSPTQILLAATVASGAGAAAAIAVFPGALSDLARRIGQKATR